MTIDYKQKITMMPEESHMYGKQVALGPPIKELVAHVYRNPESNKSLSALGWNAEFLDRRQDVYLKRPPSLM